MNTIRGIELCTGSREELLPGFARDFPYIATRAELDDYLVPWHWHKTVELFYVESGSLEYHTPGGRVVFGAGSGGMVNRDVLHMTKPLCRTQKNIQLLHIFDPSLLGGEPGSHAPHRAGIFPQADAEPAARGGPSPLSERKSGDDVLGTAAPVRGGGGRIGPD